MHLRRLHLEHLRRIESASLVPGSGLNLLLGANGAGKTTILEALSLLNSGRSFRRGAGAALVRVGASALLVQAELASDAGVHQIGLMRSAHGWEGRVDGRALPRLSDLYRHCPVVTFHPESHELIAGPSEGRRQFLDWALFHVEPEFLAQWRRYRRALDQRNAAIDQAAPPEAMALWEAELSRSGSWVDAQRRVALREIEQALREIGAELFPELGAATLRYRPGWVDDGAGLIGALLASRAQDRVRGFTGIGPHRSGWAVSFPSLPRREYFSRGQQKLIALGLLLAQMAWVAMQSARPAVLALDDLGAELDHPSQIRVLSYLRSLHTQVWITATGIPNAWRGALGEHAVFHVEQGVVTGPL